MAGRPCGRWPQGQPLNWPIHFFAYQPPGLVGPRHGETEFGNWAIEDQRNNWFIGSRHGQLNGRANLPTWKFDPVQAGQLKQMQSQIIIAVAQIQSGQLGAVLNIQCLDFFSGNMNSANKSFQAVPASTVQFGAGQLDGSGI
ncbi:MAG TPA: hypothetical protein VK064_01930 [Wenzhouxiangella sp.]|nr:hypothetical protein [Wenzhouxiangella sp.]